MPTEAMVYYCDHCDSEYESMSAAERCEKDCAKRLGLNSDDQDHAVEVENLLDRIERREDYPVCRTTMPAEEQCRIWLAIEEGEPFDEDQIDQLRRWAMGTDPLPERRVGNHRERLFPLPEGIDVL